MPRKTKKSEEKKKVGRPPMFDNPEDMQVLIDNYFKDCPDLMEMVSNEGIITKVPCPTITGLALYLGFCDRRSFYEYEIKPKFTHTIKSARTRMEIIYEMMLRKGNCTGAIFALKNFGWTDKQTIEHEGLEGAYEKYRGMSDEELNRRYAELSRN